MNNDDHTDISEGLQALHRVDADARKRASIIEERKRVEALADAARNPFYALAVTAVEALTRIAEALEARDD